MLRMINSPARPAHDVAEDFSELDAHLYQCLLYALNPTGLLCDQNVALTRHCAQFTHLNVGAKCSA